MQPGSPDNNRTVIESETFAASKAKLRIEPRLLDDLLEGIIFFLSRMPQWGWQIGNTKLYAITLDLPVDPYEAVVYYTFDDERVVLEDIFSKSPSG